MSNDGLKQSKLASLNSVQLPKQSVGQVQYIFNYQCNRVLVEHEAANSKYIIITKTFHDRLHNQQHRINWKLQINPRASSQYYRQSFPIK